MVFDPDKWATSFFRSFGDYIKSKLDLDIYDVVMSYPSVEKLTEMAPLPKTVIHFEIDDPKQVFFGFGDNIVNQVYNEAPVGTVEEWEAHCHEVTLDVGVWASIESGGPSSRLEAREDLDKALNGPMAREACMTDTNGVEILTFTGGQFLPDKIGDLDVFRIVGMELRVRVYSRTRRVPVEFIESADQDPDLVIDGNVTIDP